MTAGDEQTPEMTLTPEQLSDWSKALGPTPEEIADEAREHEESAAAKELADKARRKMVTITCAMCTHKSGKKEHRRELGAVHDSPEGPLLLLAFPVVNSDLLQPLKPLLGRVSPVKNTYVRRIDRDDWTGQELHCDSHGDRFAARESIVDLVDRYRRDGKLKVLEI